MRALLISTYDLGRQPFGLASPAAWLRRSGVEVDCVDTSRERLTDDRLAAASLVGFYLPMHTATRMAAGLITRTRRLNPGATLVAYGLYAPLNEEWLRESGVHVVLGPECEGELVEVAGSVKVQTPNPKPQIPNPKIARLAFIQPDRQGLQPLQRYASLRMPDGDTRVVGSTEASRGCKHLCRHCPIVPVYQGQFRVVPIDVVLADVRAQVEAGAAHISFGDPDFFNGPTHAMRLVDRFAAEFPGVSYDVTIKIEHLLEQADLLPALRRSGCLFITSAVESVDDRVLEKLRKGHTRADFFAAVRLCRDEGLTISPTFVPFTPWTTVDGYVALLDSLEELDLVEQVAPIQLAIRLLITSGSPLLELEDVRAQVGAFDPGSLTWPWRHPDPRVDALQDAVMRQVGSRGTGDRGQLFDVVRGLACDAAGLPPARVRVRSAAAVPYLDEPWYCCAEPAADDIRLV